MKDHLIYLASPYSHADHKMQELRFNQICEVAGFMLNNGWHVHSPIAHTHPIACKCSLPKDYAFWQGYNKAVLSRCSHLIIVKMDGWNKSVGVHGEFLLALEMNIPIHHMDYPDYERWLSDNKEILHG